MWGRKWRSLPAWFAWLFLLAVQAGAQAGLPPLLITEVYYDTPGRDGEEEWVELANPGPGTVDLSQFKLGDEESPGGGEGMARFPPGASAAPGQVILVAQTADGFQRLFGFLPDYEWHDSRAEVPDMLPYPAWATGEVGLANDGDEVLLLDGADRVVDALNYGQKATYFSPPVVGVRRGESIARVPAFCDSNSAADWQQEASPAPGTLVTTGTCKPAVAPPPVTPEQLLPIGAIQGALDASPLQGQRVTFLGQVTGLLEDRNAAGTVFYTLFLQDPAGAGDGDPATSDGLAVFAGRTRPSVQTGDLVRVSGTVTEFFGLTEIDDNGLELLLEGHSDELPAPILLQPPADNQAAASYFEPLEGMRVAVDGPATVIGPSHAGCGFAVAAPGQAPAGHVLRHAANDPVGQVINVLNQSDVACAGFPQVNVGDEVSQLAGPLTYHFDRFKVVVQQPEALAIASQPPPLPPGVPALEPGQLSVATFNLENFFDLVDDTGSDAEPKPSAGELAIKQSKLAYAIGQMAGCPTLLGVQEVENAALLVSLAAELSPACGFTYQITHRDSPDVRGIDVALLSDPRLVMVEEASLQQACTPLQTDTHDATANCPEGQFPLFSRPPLQVTVRAAGQRLTLLVNHFKSKRGGEAETAPLRLAQGRFVAGLVTALLAAQPDAGILVMGDFNDYDRSPALLLLEEEGGLQNALQQLPAETRYSFIFDGAAQLLDDIFISPALAGKVAAAGILHLNADFAAAFSLDRSPEGLPFHSSDHDIPWLLLQPGSIPAATPPPLAPTVTATATATLPASGGTPLPALSPTPPTPRPEVTATAPPTSPTPAPLPPPTVPAIGFPWLALLLLLPAGLGLRWLWARRKTKRNRR